MEGGSFINQELLADLQKITPEEQDILSGNNRIDRNIFLEQTNVVDCKKILETGRLIQVRTHARFIHYPPHSHNYIEMIYMCSGSTTHIVNGIRIRLQTGELLLLNQQAVQEILPAGYDDVAVNFIILPEFFDFALSLISREENLLRDFLITCLRGEQKNVGFLHFRVSDVLPIQNLLENLIWTIHNNLPNKRSINQVTMGLLFLQLVNHTDRLTNEEGNSGQGLILTVLRYIDEHYRDGSFSELASLMNYDPCWLSRVIRRQSGKTYTELLQTKRLNQAAFLLKTTRLPVSEIGISVGYDNVSYFYRIFRDKYHCSPREYRQNF